MISREVNKFEEILTDFLGRHTEDSLVVEGVDL
jgi:hypothetical protein